MAQRFAIRAPKGFKSTYDPIRWIASHIHTEIPKWYLENRCHIFFVGAGDGAKEVLTSSMLVHDYNCKIDQIIVLEPFPPKQNYYDEFSSLASNFKLYENKMEEVQQLANPPTVTLFYDSLHLSNVTKINQVLNSLIFGSTGAPLSFVCGNTENPFYSENGFMQQVLAQVETANSSMKAKKHLFQIYIDLDEANDEEISQGLLFSGDDERIRKYTNDVMEAIKLAREKGEKQLKYSEMACFVFNRMVKDKLDEYDPIQWYKSVGIGPGYE